jgi:hypothetical protein
MELIALHCGTSGCRSLPTRPPSPSDSLRPTFALGDVRFVENGHLHNDHAGMHRYFGGSTVLERAFDLDYATAQMDGPYTGHLGNDFQGDDATIETIENDCRRPPCRSRSSRVLPRG